MTGDVIPREVAIRNLCAVRDRALYRLARDRAAGRLTPEQELALRRIERNQARRATAPTADRAAA
jgi:hypothetical protein